MPSSRHRLKAFEDRLPGAVAFREVTPRGAGMEDPEDAIDDRTGIAKRVACLAVMSTVWKEGSDPCPLWLGEFIAAHGRTRWGNGLVWKFGVTHYHIPPNHRQTEISVRLTNEKQSLGAGEAANWPGATKAVSEWFPAKERSIAVALFDSGSAIGGAVAPALVVWLFHVFGTWRPAFLITGALGFLWLLAWMATYHRPEEHPQISDSERAMILKTRSGADETPVPDRVPVSMLLRYRQTWGVILAKAILDPYWFLVADWFALFLVSRGFKLEETLVGFWIPFVCADLGNFVGGGLSSYFIHRGWSVGAARRIIFLICGPLMLLMIPAAYTTQLWLLIAEFGLATLGYAACATIFLTLPSDLFESGSVATVSGLAGMVTGFVTIAATYAIGAVTDMYSFAPILLGASAAPVLAAIAVFALVRNTRNTGNGVLLRI